MKKGQFTAVGLKEGIILPTKIKKKRSFTELNFIILCLTDGTN